MKTMLIVEDNVFSATLFSLVAEQEGMTPKVFRTGQHAVQWLKTSGEANVIVLDTTLPGERAEEIFLELRKWQSDNPPKIVVAAMDTSSVKAYLGVSDAVIYKPVAFSEFAHILRKLV